jgi:hypothetical protein
MGLFSIFLVGAAATRCAGAIREGRRLFKQLLKSWVLVWKGRKFLIFQGELTDTLSAIRLRFGAACPRRTASDGGPVRTGAKHRSYRGTNAGHLPYWRMKASRSATTDILAGLALAIALGATVYYGYLAWLLVSPD